MFLYYYGIMYLLCLCVLVGCIFCYVLPNQNNTTAVRFRIIVNTMKKNYIWKMFTFSVLLYIVKVILLKLFENGMVRSK